MKPAIAIPALLLASGGCGFSLDVSRVKGLHADFDLARPAAEATLPECRLNVPPAASGAPPRLARYTRAFRFRGEERFVTADVDARIVEASRAIGRERCVITSRFDVDDFYEAVVFDPAEEPFFEALLIELRRLRVGLGLDDSGYAELLAAFVQSLDYEPGDAMPKHPIAAFAEARGDCDEKSALLAGLLAREGYDVCLMLFEDEQHMAVGLRSAGPTYRDSGYAWVEATQPAYVGFGPWGLQGPAPRFIDVGDGALVYQPGVIPPCPDEAYAAARPLFE